MTRALAIAIGVLSLGCARNAVLELELELPPGAALVAIVQGHSDGDFDAEWPPESEIPAIALSSSCARSESPPPCGERTLDPSCSAVVSIVGDGDEIEAPLNVRVRFCGEADCTAGVEHRVTIERAFYVGRYTQARVCIDEVPADTNDPPQSIARCDVRCRDGLAASHCRADGTHFCE